MPVMNHKNDIKIPIQEEGYGSCLPFIKEVALDVYK